MTKEKIFSIKYYKCLLAKKILKNQWSNKAASEHKWRISRRSSVCLMKTQKWHKNFQTEDNFLDKLRRMSYLKVWDYLEFMEHKVLQDWDNLGEEIMFWKED